MMTHDWLSLFEALPDTTVHRHIEGESSHLWRGHTV